MKTITYFTFLFLAILSLACTSEPSEQTQTKVEIAPAEKPLLASNEETPTEQKEVATVEPNAPEKTKQPAKKMEGQKKEPEASTAPEAKNKETNTPNTAPSSDPQKQEEENGEPISHDIWDGLLKKHVSSAGRVDYGGFVKDKGKLQEYLDLLSANPPQDSWSRADKLAFWINAYNAFTVKLIVDNHPVSSITKLHGGKPWDQKWIKIGSKTYSLNNIENDVIRPKFNEPRIHFAVNCAAKSCPPLLNQAWTAGNLQRNFEKQAKAFINNEQFNKISADAVTVSKIFDWYKADFDNLIGFLNKYSDTKIKGDAKVDYMEYDWALNK